MGTALSSNRKLTTAIQQFSASPKNLVEPGSKVQEAIWQLQDEVRILQEVLTRTRRALDQREVLLRNSNSCYAAGDCEINLTDGQDRV